jgi:ABC-type lipoprotein export system ATPase subunit
LTDILKEVVGEILLDRSLEKGVSDAMEILTRALEAEVGIIWLLDKNKERLVPVFSISPVDLSNFSVEVGGNAESYVAKTSQSLLKAEMTEDERYNGTILDDVGLKVRNMICVPLGNRQGSIGCIEFANRKNNTPFSEDELQLCEHMAAVAAFTIYDQGITVEAAEKKEVLISMRGIIKEYPNGDSITRVLKGIDLDIYKGEFLVILGESGCGKSTLVNIVGGMDNLTEGSISVEGKDYSHPTDDELTMFRREYVGFVFQSYNLMPNLTAQENVRFIADLVEEPMKPADAIAKVGLSERAGHFPSALSGGQQQRVSIARAIVKRPKIIFADEPTAALDYETSIEVLTVFEEIVQEEGSTVVMITHNPEIAKMADRVVKLRNGLVSSVKTNLHPAKAKELVW